MPRSTSRSSAASAASSAASASSIMALLVQYKTSVLKNVDDRFNRFFAQQRSVTEKVGGRIDIMSDNMTVSCEEITEAPAKSIDEVSIPLHHFRAINTLYRKNRKQYNVLLGAANKFRKLRSSNSLEYRQHLEKSCRA